MLNDAKAVSKREFLCNIGLPQETRKFSTSNFTFQRTRKRRTKPKVSRRKEIIKIRAEISEITSKKAIEKIDETKSWFFEKINKSANL